MSSGICIVLAIFIKSLLQTAADICLQTAVLASLSFFFLFLETLRWERTATVCSIHRLITPKLPLAFSSKTFNYWVCIISQQHCSWDRVYGVMSVLLQQDLRAKWMSDSQVVMVLMESGSIFLSSHISGWCVIIINEEHLPVGVLYLSREVSHTWTLTHAGAVSRTHQPHWKCNTFEIQTLIRMQHLQHTTT